MATRQYCKFLRFREFSCPIFFYFFTLIINSVFVKKLLAKRLYAYFKVLANIVHSNFRPYVTSLLIFISLFALFTRGNSYYYLNQVDHPNITLQQQTIETKWINAWVFFGKFICSCTLQIASSLWFCQNQS